MRLLLFATLLAAAANAAPVGSCAGSSAVASFQIYAEKVKDGPKVPLRTLNELSPGMRLVYQPRLPGQSKKAEIAVVLGTASGLEVLESRKAAKPAIWTVPERTSVLGVVYGPQGLDEKKVGKLVRNDSELIGQLAEFAEKTNQTEAVIDALLSPAPGQSLDSVLAGMSALSPGVRLEKKSATDQQALALLRALTPALSTYDPLAPEPKRVEQSMSAAASIAGMFFGSGVGLAAGGATVLGNLRTLIFPGTEFHSSFTQASGSDSMTLCTKRQAGKARTRQAYLWAVRLPDVGPPAAQLKTPAHVPAGIRSTITLDCADCARLGRVQQWFLNDTPVAARAMPESKSLELDLTKFAGGPGVYRLTGKWDFSKLDTGGTVEVHPIPDLRKARVKAASQDRLETVAGVVPVDLEGTDFEFIEKLSFRRNDDRSGHATDLYFKLPGGKRSGIQPVLQTEIDTKALLPGEYTLTLTQAGGKAQDVPVRVLPPQPKISNLPLRVNFGEKAQSVTLEGSGLNRIQSIECNAAEISLAGKTATVKLKPIVKPGKKLDLLVKVEGLSEPLRFAGGLEVVGRRPRLLSVKTSFPAELGVAMRDGELPAGAVISLSLELAENLSQPEILLRCRGGADHRLDARPLGDYSLFLSFNPAAVGNPGCEVEVSVQNRSEGRSESKRIGRIVRLPAIDSFQLTDEKAAEGVYVGILTGNDLETIEKTGWDEKQGTPVLGLPVVSGQKQTLKIAVPWPSPAPHSPVYVWLRGETEGRATRVRY